jgi:hypothetical protein
MGGVSDTPEIALSDIGCACRLEHIAIGGGVGIADIVHTVVDDFAKALGATGRYRPLRLSLPRAFTVHRSTALLGLSRTQG